MALEIQKVDTQEVTDLILAMDAELVRCKEAADELAVTPEVLAERPYDEVKRLASSLSQQIKQADEARKQFKREWQKPQKAVEAAFKEALEPMNGLLALYKSEQAKREAQIRQERYELLCGFYEQDAPMLAELVPIERFGIIRDKISVAKSYSAVAEEAKLHAKLVKALNAWDVLRENELEFADEAEAEFFRTLDLNAALALNARRKAEQEKIEQLHAELGVALEPAPEPQPVPVEQPEPEPAQPVEVPQRADSPATAQKTLLITATPAQWFGLKGYMKATGIDYQLK